MSDRPSQSQASLSKVDPARVIAWQLTPPVGAESCRWLSADGRWISVTLGSDEDLGTVFVTSSDGRHNSVPTYEQALELARTWRT